MLRDGRKVWVHGKKLVRGDVVVLRKHDLVPADVRVFESNDLVVDNRLINGTCGGERKVGQSFLIGSLLTLPTYQILVFLAIVIDSY